jgi:hypothetical protein
MTTGAKGSRARRRWTAGGYDRIWVARMRCESPSVRRVCVRSIPSAVDARPVMNPSRSFKARC